METRNSIKVSYARLLAYKLEMVKSEVEDPSSCQTFED